MADGARVAGGGAVAGEVVGRLRAHARVLARAGVAAVDHLARVERQLARAAVLLGRPVARQPVVAVHRDLAHAADEPARRRLASCPPPHTIINNYFTKKDSKTRPN